MPSGRIVSSTVPSRVPGAQMRDIGRQVLAIFEGARKANLQFSELVVQYAAFKITARANARRRDHFSFAPGLAVRPHALIIYYAQQEIGPTHRAT